MGTPRVIIAHTLVHMRAAFAAAKELGTPLTLQTATGALRFAGAQYLLNMFKLAQAECPEVAATLVLDCGDAGAETIAAMRLGHTHIRMDAPDAMRAKLADIAAQLKVQVVEGEYEALDLRYCYQAIEASKKFLSHT